MTESHHPEAEYSPPQAQLQQSDLLRRREFIFRLAAGGCALCAGLSLDDAANGAAHADQDQATLLDGGVAEETERYTAPALYWEEKVGLIVCKLCPRECSVPPRERGYCGVRENQQGEYKTLVYSRPCSLLVDPIEKKPLSHFLPGTTALSLATAGCNIECKFCQNWQLSQMRPEQVAAKHLSPKQIVGHAVQTGAPTIAFTYSEPVVFFEYMLDIAKEGKKRRINAVMISNGYIQKEPLAELLPHLSAIKIDLKAFTEKFYKESCSGELQPVLDRLQQIKAAGLWLELVVLIIPTLNDSAEECRKMCQWIFKNLGPDTAIHFSAFRAMYKLLRLPPTPVTTLERNRKIAVEEGLPYAYIGNVPGHPGEHTYCSKCDKIVIKRQGYRTQSLLKNGKCPFCETIIPGVFVNPLKSLY